MFHSPAFSLIVIPPFNFGGRYPALARTARANSSVPQHRADLRLYSGALDALQFTELKKDI